MSSGEPPTQDQQVAVVIVNYNGGEHILNCLDALSRQTRTPSRIIIVDNDSTDGSAESVAERYPDCLLLRQSTNLGFAAGNNQALKIIESIPWIILLNPDTRPREEWLEKLMLAARENPQIDAFSSKLLWTQDTRIIDGTGDIYHVSGLSWRRHYGLPDSEENNMDEPVFSPCAAAALYRTEKVLQVDGFDENYFCYHEDVDLMFRMRLHGAHCLHVDDAVVEHMGSGITGYNSDFSVYYGHRNLVWTYIKNMPGWLFWKYLPQHLLLNLASLLHYTVKGRAAIIFKSKWHALKGLPRVVKQRKNIQRQRKVAPGSLEQGMVTGFFRPYFHRHR